MRVAALRVAVLLCGMASLSSTGCTMVQPVQPVREGAFYRSGQLSPRELETAVREHDIKTVVNLRGAQPEAKWYQDQRRVLKELGVKQVDIAIGMTTPDAERHAELLAAFRDEDKPMLVHSQWGYGGAAGYASGLYRVAIEKDPPDVARKELAFWQTKHLPFIPGAELDKALAGWPGDRGEDRKASGGMIAAKGKRSAGLGDFGLEALDEPMPGAVAEHSAAKRYPWGGSKTEKNDDRVEAASVVLGLPKPIPEDRIADRADGRRY